MRLCMFSCGVVLLVKVLHPQKGGGGGRCQQERCCHSLGLSSRCPPILTRSGSGCYLFELFWGRYTLSYNKAFLPGCMPAATNPPLNLPLMSLDPTPFGNHSSRSKHANLYLLKLQADRSLFFCSMEMEHPDQISRPLTPF